VVNQVFAEIWNTSIVLGADDGNLGLAYPNITRGSETPFFYNMWAQNLIPLPMFSFYFNPYVK
jgi:hypothetical protein